MKYNILAQIDNYVRELDKKLEEVVNETLDYGYQELIKSMPIRTGVYKNATKIDYAKKENGVIKGRIYNGILVAKSGKWSKVLLACILEWGTGTVGEGTNNYPHGYSYRQTPWCYYDEYLQMWVTTRGMIARPHWQPTFEKLPIKMSKLLKEKKI